jgi:hypothetical protein
LQVARFVGAVAELGSLGGTTRMKILIITLGVLILLGFLIFRFVRKPKPVDKSLATYAGKIKDYRGDKKLVVVFTASWASVWKVTVEALRKLDFSRFDLHILDDATDRLEIKRHGITLLPTVILVENGRITKSIPNLTTIDQIRDW